MTLPALDMPHDPHATEGLCSTCRYSETCIYLQNGDARAVWQCELFDDGRDNRRTIALACEPEPEIDVAITAQPLRGLCANCDVREACTLRPPRGGVWHCEEYR